MPFIHKKKNIKLNADENAKIKQFNNTLKDIATKLSKSEIHPVAIISISIPNGQLIPHYDDEIVSGKSWGKSIRYHYDKGIFKGLGRDKSRVIFIDYNKAYLLKLKNYFRNIICYSLIETNI